MAVFFDAYTFPIRYLEMPRINALNTASNVKNFDVDASSEASKMMQCRHFYRHHHHHHRHHHRREYICSASITKNEENILHNTIVPRVSQAIKTNIKVKNERIYWKSKANMNR